MKIVFVYRVVRQKLFHPELGLYCTFGLLALHVCAGQGKLLYFVQDVSDDVCTIALVQPLPPRAVCFVNFV